MEAIWYVAVFALMVLWLYWLRKWGPVRFALYLFFTAWQWVGLYTVAYAGFTVLPAHFIAVLVLTLAPPVCWLVERAERARSGEVIE